MIRPFTLLCGVFAAGSMLYLYQSKHQAQMLDREIAHTLKAADDVKARIGMLRAEYQMLNDPARLQELADKHLALRPTAPTQFTILTDIARRLPPIELAPPELPPEPPETELFELPPAPPPAPPPAVVAAPPPVVAAAPKPAAPAPRPAPPQVVASAPPPSAKPAVLAPAPAVPAVRTAVLPAPSVTPAVPARPAPSAVTPAVSAIASSRAGIAATPLPAPTTMPAATQQAVQRPQLQQVSAVRPVPEVHPAYASALGMARSVIRPAPSSPAANVDGPAR